MAGVFIRKYIASDADAVWEIIHAVIATGTTYAFDPETPRDHMMAYWAAPDRHTYVAEMDGKIAGTFVLRDNQPGLGNHIANGSYMVASWAEGKSVGRQMGAFSIDEAKRLGYRALQFNIVVSTNERAVALWKSLGFSILCEIPNAFRHRSLGMVSAYVMHREV